MITEVLQKLLVIRKEIYLEKARVGKQANNWAWKELRKGRTINLSLPPPYAGEVHEMAPFGVMQISNLNVQWCLYSLHRSDCTSKELGAWANISVQLIMTFVFRYIFLKQTGGVAHIWPLDGQIIKQPNSFDNSFTHVVITFGAVVSDTWNLHAKSSCSKPRRDLIISRNSCSNDNFFFGLFLLVGGRSFGPYIGDDNIIFQKQSSGGVP